MEKTPEAAAERRRYVRLLSTAAALAALGSGLFMASAHVQTIPGELLKLLSGIPQIPSGGGCNTAPPSYGPSPSNSTRSWQGVAR